MNWFLGKLFTSQAEMGKKHGDKDLGNPLTTLHAFLLLLTPLPYKEEETGAPACS